MIHRYAVYKVKQIMRRLSGNPPTDDDFDWGVYHLHYQQQIENLQHKYTQILQEGDYTFQDGELLRQRNIKPLHPNHRLLYETIVQLTPRTVLEVGCGWGDHLRNLSTLKPSFVLNGRDINEKQLHNLRQRHPGLTANLEVFDFTLPFSERLPRVDLCYTQAVIMHIQTGNSHLVALSNMFRCANKTVVLMENWERHDFVKDIKWMYENQMIPWKNLYLYRKTSKGSDNTTLLICSSKKLPLEPVTSDTELITRQRSRA